MPCIALNVILSRVGSIRIGAGDIEIVESVWKFSYCFCWHNFRSCGGHCGAIGDLVGMIISPIGRFMPHFTLNAALIGVIPGLVMLKCKDKKCLTSFWKLCLAILPGQVIASILLWAYFQNTLFAMPYAVILPARIISQLINVPIYAYMTKILVNRMPMAIKNI